MSRDLTKAVPLLQEFALKLIEAYAKKYPGRKLVVTHVDRTPVEQLLLFVQGRLPQFPGEVVTWKDGFVNKSRHNDIPSKAIDVAIIVNGVADWSMAAANTLGPMVAELGYSAKIRWGGDFNDRYHFEAR